MEDPRSTENDVINQDDSPSLEANDDVNKHSASGLNKNLLRCLLLLLPVAIPVVVYLKDIDATRRIFLAVFILFLVVVFSCMLMALLRARSRYLEGTPSASDVAIDGSQRNIITVTNRFLPRPFPHSHLRCHRSHTDMMSGHIRRGVQELNPHNHLSVHYHLAPSGSRSPSPHRFDPSVCSEAHLSLLHAQLNLLHEREADEELALQIIQDDPPPYEEALHCPLASPHRYKIHIPNPETPPPSYDRAVT